MKMKRINVIVKGKGILESVLNRKAKRLERCVSQAVDSFRDEADEHREAAEDIINRMGSCATPERTEELNGLINEYCDYLTSAEAYDKRAVICEGLLKKLNEEVEVVED